MNKLYFTNSYSGSGSGDFAERMRVCRQHSGLKQTDAESKLGVTKGTLSRYERGQTKETKITGFIQKCAELYKVSAMWLYAGSDCPPPGSLLSGTRKRGATL